MGSCFSKKTNIYTPNNLDKNTSPLVTGVTFVRKDSFLQKDAKKDEIPKSETPVIIVTSVSTAVIEDLVTVEERQELAHCDVPKDDSDSSDDEQDFTAVPDPCQLAENNAPEIKHEQNAAAEKNDDSSSSSDEEDAPHHLAENSAHENKSDSVTEQQHCKEDSKEDVVVVVPEEKNDDSSSSSDEEEEHRENEPQSHLVNTFETCHPSITLDVIQEVISSDHQAEPEEGSNMHPNNDDAKSDLESNKEVPSEPSHIDTDVIIAPHVAEDDADSSESSDDDEKDSKSHDSEKDFSPKSVHFDSNLEKHIPDDNVHIEEVNNSLEIPSDDVAAQVPGHEHRPLGLTLSMEYLSKMDINGAQAIPIPEIESYPIPEIESIPMPDIESYPMPEIESMPDISSVPIPEIDSDSSTSDDEDAIHYVPESDTESKSVTDSAINEKIAETSETGKGNAEVVREGRFRIESLTDSTKE